jgi:hypothetical protein
MRPHPSITAILSPEPVGVADVQADSGTPSSGFSSWQPYAWDYDLIVLGFAVVWLWQNGDRAGFFLGKNCPGDSGRDDALFWRPGSPNGCCQRTDFPLGGVFIRDKARAGI